MRRLDQMRIPDGVQFGRLAEEGHSDGIAAQIALVTRVHRAVQIAHKVYEHTQGNVLLLLGEPPLAQARDDVVQGGYDVTRLVAGHRLIGIALVDIGIVPRTRIGIFGCMARIVQPVGIVYGRMSLQRRGYTLCRAP